MKKVEPKKNQIYYNFVKTPSFSFYLKHSKILNLKGFSENFIRRA